MASRLLSVDSMPVILRESLLKSRTKTELHLGLRRLCLTSEQSVNGNSGSNSEKANGRNRPRIPDEARLQRNRALASRKSVLWVRPYDVQVERQAHQCSRQCNPTSKRL